MGRTPSKKKEAEIVRLYTNEKLGAKAISSYFNGRPCRSTIIKILLKHGVYRGEEAACKPDETRRKRVLLDERERRRRMAVCLRGLRKGQSVEGTCREHGWNVRSIWNHLRSLRSYHTLRQRRARKYPDQIKARRDGLWLSKQYPKERNFQEAIRQVLDEAGCSYSIEPSIKGLRVNVETLRYVGSARWRISYDLDTGGDFPALVVGSRRLLIGADHTIGAGAD